MLAIRRFVRGSLTLADTGEQLFPLLCAINVPLTSSLPVLLTIEISPPSSTSARSTIRLEIGALTRRGGARASAAGSQHTSSSPAEASTRR
jgi:hypothetical protein